MRPSNASAWGELMSIGSSATNTRPSGAEQTTDGWRISGACVTSSTRQSEVDLSTVAPKHGGTSERITTPATHETGGKKTPPGPFDCHALLGCIFPRGLL